MDLGMTTLRHTLLAAMLAVAVAGSALARAADVPAASPSGVLGVTDVQLDPSFWVARQPDASAAAAAASRTVSRMSCSGQYWLAGW